MKILRIVPGNFNGTAFELDSWPSTKEQDEFHEWTMQAELTDLVKLTTFDRSYYGDSSQWANFPGILVAYHDKAAIALCLLKWS